MPRITLPLVDEHERPDVEEAIQVVNGAVNHRDATLTIEHDGSDGQPAVISHLITAPQYYRQHIADAFQTVDDMLQQGKVTITYSKSGYPSLEIATQTVASEYPIAHMDPAEEEQFQQAVNAVNTGIGSRHCRFESFLDYQANILFRYSIEDSAPNRDQLHQHINLIIDAVNTGKAVRVELPDGAVMLMPRWNLQRHR